MHPGRSTIGHSTARRFATLAALASLALAGIGVAPASAADPSLVLRIGTTQEDASVSPLRFSGWLSTSLSYDMLVGADPAGQPTPAFAESWSVAPDGITWTIKIRSGMTWSDGQPATARDAAFTIDYLTEVTDPVWGGPYFSHWGLKDLVSATATDDLTLVVVTKPPKRAWLPVSRLFVLPEHIWKDVKIADAAQTYDPALPSVGTGPYILTEAKAGQFRRYVRNEHYWGRKPAVEEILLVPFKSQDSMAAALKSGEIDIAPSLSIGLADDLAKDPALKVLETAQNSVMMLAFNNTGKGSSTTALTDPAFRDAIGYALDKQTLIDRVFNGHAALGQGLVSPANKPNYGDLSSIARTFDVAEAAKRLDAAGFKAGADGTRLDKEGKPLNLKLILNASDPTNALVAQFIAGWLGQIGIKVTPVSLEIGAYYGAVYGPDYDLDIFSGGYDANQFILTQGTSNANGMGFSSPEYDTLWAQYTGTYEAAAKLDLAAAMDRTFYQAAPGHALVYPTQIAAYRTDKFTGWTDPASPDEFTLMGMSWPIPMINRLAAVVVATPSPVATSAPSATAAPAASPTPSPSGTGTDGSGGDSTLILVIGAIAVVVVLAVVFSRRRRA